MRQETIHPVHPKRSTAARSGAVAVAPPAYGIDFVDSGQSAVQLRAHEGVSLPGPTKVLGAACRGTSGAGTSLPHLEQIQRSFGRHDVAGIAAHVDSHASAAAREMGARAFAVGSHVAFAGPTTLHTAAHEAAHVIQQRGGVQLKGGVGESGDRHERHADAVGDLVVQGRSAEALLDQHVAGGDRATAGSHGQVQMVRVRDSRNNEETDTEKLLEEQGPGALAALALTFYSLHNIDELKKIQQHHYEGLMKEGYNISDEALIMLSAPVVVEKGGIDSSKGSELLEDSKPLGKIAIRKGLIHGTYDEETNSIDLHVDAKGGSGGLDPQDMLDVAVLCHQYMMAREKRKGPRGQFILHPTGAAIVKIMVEILGEALGGWFSKTRAEWLQYQRKKGGSGGQKSMDKLSSDVLPEHFAYLDSVRGSGTVSIVPRIVALNKDKYGNTEQNFNQDMMTKDKLGDAQYQRYKDVLQDKEEPIGPGLDVTIYSDQLPAIIELLKSHLKKK